MIKTLLLATSLYTADSAPIHYNTNEHYAELTCVPCERHHMLDSYFIHNVTENTTFDIFITEFVKNYHNQVVIPIHHESMKEHPHNLQLFKSNLLHKLEASSTPVDYFESKVIDQVSVHIWNDGFLTYRSLEN